MSELLLLVFLRTFLIYPHSWPKNPRTRARKGHEAKTRARCFLSH